MKVTHVIMVIAALTTIGTFAALTIAEGSYKFNTKAETEKKTAATKRHEGTDSISEKELLTWLEQYYPEGLELFREANQEKFSSYELTRAMLTEMMLELEAVRENRPELFKRLIEAATLENRSWQLAGEIAQTNDEATQKQLTNELRETLITVFDIRMEERTLEIQELEWEIQELENEVQNMKSTLEKRNVIKEKIIEQHMKELLYAHDEDLNWW